MPFDFLALHDHDPDLLTALIGRAREMAEMWAARRMPDALAGRRVALVVDDGGWRNTTAFDLGVQALGGTCVHAPITLAGREAIGDLAAYVDNWFDAIIVRTPELARLRTLADAARAPVVNARTRTNHPCETLGDLAYIHHALGRIEGLRVAVVAPDANIIRSWVEAARVLPFTVVQIYPQAWHVRDPALVGPRFRATADMAEIAGADVVVTDSWAGGAAADALVPYRITAAVLDGLDPQALFIPCPPVARGEEVSEDAMRHPTCRVVAAKAFLLHAQNALLERILAVS